MTRLPVLIERRKSLAKKQNIFSEPIRNTWINVLGKGLVICRSLPLAPPQQSMLLDNSGGEPEAKCLPFIHLNWQVVMVKNFTTFRTNNGKINEPGQILFVWKYAEKPGRRPQAFVWGGQSISQRDRGVREAVRKGKIGDFDLNMASQTLNRIEIGPKKPIGHKMSKVFF